MKLGIIIPTLNEEAQLKILLPYLNLCAINQNIEIIVVDAHLSDDNTALICQDNDITYIKCIHTSRSKQMNVGAKANGAEMLFFLHADVLPPQSFIEDIKSTLTNNEVGMFCYQFKKANWLMKINAYVTKFDTRLSGGGDQGLILSKVLFESLGGYNETLSIMEDFDLFKRIKKAKLKYSIIQNPCITSNRKYRNNSWPRVNLVNLITIIRYNRGVTDGELKVFYKKWLR